jgi:hypothetical protein
VRADMKAVKNEKQDRNVQGGFLICTLCTFAASGDISCD